MRSTLLIFKNKTVGGCPTASRFFLLRQEKVTKKKATQAYRPYGVPCVAQQVRLPHKLARSATQPRTQTYSSEFPDPSALLSDAHGNYKDGFVCAMRTILFCWARRLRPPRGFGGFDFPSPEHRRVAENSQGISARTV